jgi:extracellular elastinolytic metalloproteinase
VIDNSSYRVLEVPKESPNDGDRTLVANPADAEFSPFGWHDTNGVAGAEFTVTRGNNAHAYTDRDNDGVPDPGSDPDGTAGLDFDFPLDLNEHPQTYSTPASRTSSTGTTSSTTSWPGTGSKRPSATSR